MRRVCASEEPAALYLGWEGRCFGSLEWDPEGGEWSRVFDCA